MGVWPRNILVGPLFEWVSEWWFNAVSATEAIFTAFWKWVQDLAPFSKFLEAALIHCPLVYGLYWLEAFKDSDFSNCTGIPNGIMKKVTW